MMRLVSSFLVNNYLQELRIRILYYNKKNSHVWMYVCVCSILQIRFLNYLNCIESDNPE